MNEALKGLDNVVNAEDFFALFDLEFDPGVVRVNRLHILKKFAILKAEIDRDHKAMAPEERFTRYRDAFKRAYATFLTRTAPEEKLFKVFQEPVPGLVTITSGAKAG